MGVTEQTGNATALAAAVARYHAGCLRVIGAQNVGQLDVRTARKASYPCDLGQLIGVEELLRHGRAVVRAPENPGASDPAARELYKQRLAIWERLRELTLKAAVEAHQKEVIYASPLLAGVLWKKTQSVCEPVLAPLFLQTVTVTGEDDGSLLISATSEPPRFNTSVWANAFTKTQADQIVTLGINAQADLAEGWDDDRVEELLSGLNAVFPGASKDKPTDALEPWPERLAPAQAAKLQPHLRLHSGAALYLANKSSPYLLADLDRIAETPERYVGREGPLSVLLNPPAAERRPELDQLDIHEVVFPFASNGPQRRVVDAVQKNRIVVVQGPPGTGKSLTIANLISHLVAEGKSVLVCSHKEQALTVVRDKLDEMQLRFLYASMIGTSANAKRELQGQIQDVKGFFARVNQHTLRRQLAEVEDRRREGGDLFGTLRDDFNTRAEAEQAEAERLLREVEGIATLPSEDPVVEIDDRARVALDLVRLDELARTYRGVWADLSVGTLAAQTDTTKEADLLSRFLELQSARLEAAMDPEVQALVREWQELAEREPRHVDAARDALRKVDEILRGPTAAIADDPDPAAVRSFAFALASDQGLLNEAHAAERKMTDAFAQARELQDSRKAVNADPARRQEVVAQRRQLESVLHRRSARKWLDEHAPGGRALSLEQIERWLGFWDAWQRVRDEGEALGGALKLEVPPNYEAATVTGYLSRLRRAVALADAVADARKTAREQSRLRLPVEDLTRELSSAGLEHGVRRLDHALIAVTADRSGNELKNDPRLEWVGAKLRSLDDAIDRENHAEAHELVSDLESTLAALPALSERARILATPTVHLQHTIVMIEMAAARDSDPPAFLRSLEQAFEAQAKVRRIEDIRAGASTRDLAERLHGLREQNLSDARQLLSLRIQQRIFEGFHSPKFTASLERFRKAISTSAKRFDRLEELKNSPEFDVDVLTEVFPCWIMRPEDACRMFPLREGIFDVVIFDEASQCNPDQTLPILARANAAVVFGDDNQLSNEDLKRSLAGDANKALLTQSGLAQLDREGLFDQTENSLLGLVSTRDQAPIVLSEHFRCRPELVAFSNRRFYENGLRVMRDGEDDRGIGPAILIHELENVPMLGRGKVNPYEAEQLVAELQSVLEAPEYEGMTIGVLSLFREQVEHIEALVEASIPAAVRERRRLICSTVDGFQGDERDVILYSWRYSPTQSPSILAFTNGRTGDQRVNVALTRARHQAIHFISAPIDRFPGSGNVGHFMRHADRPEVLVEEVASLAHKEPITEARARVAAALADAGFGVNEQFVACGVGVDLVVHDPETWARAAIFVDGELDPAPPPTTDRRVDAHAMFERAGWVVERVLAEEAFRDPEGAVQRVSAALERCGSRKRPELDRQRHTRVDVVAEPEPAQLISDELLAIEVAPEDRATYHWPAPSVEARLASGEDVFQSDFERELHDRLAQHSDLKIIPQWPSRGKFIDLVVTDRQGRRLAIEADGEAYHETSDGAQIPEDIYRQELLEEVGWVFQRVRFTEFERDPDAQIAAILAKLAQQPSNATLAAAVWADQAIVELDELEHLVESAPGEEGEASVGPRAQQLGPGSGLPVSAEVVRNQNVPETGDDRGDVVEAQARAIAADSDDGISRSQPLDAEAYRGCSFDDVPLALIASQIAIAVRDAGRVSDAALAEVYSTRFGITVEHARSRLLNSFAWSAAGRHFIQREGDSWTQGTIDPSPFEAIGSWTINGLEDLVRVMLRAETVPRSALFEALVEKVWDSGHRLPKPIAKAIGSAIYAVVGARR